jgi:hypothetical protein
MDLTVDVQVVALHVDETLLDWLLVELKAVVAEQFVSVSECPILMNLELWRQRHYLELVAECDAIEDGDQKRLLNVVEDFLPADFD